MRRLFASARAAEMPKIVKADDRFTLLATASPISSSALRSII